MTVHKDSVKSFRCDLNKCTIKLSYGGYFGTVLKYEKRTMGYSDSLGYFVRFAKIPDQYNRIGYHDEQ